MKTENRLFKARIIPMFTGLSTTLTSGDSTAGGYFETGAKTQVLSLHANGIHGQVNCWL